MSVTRAGAVVIRGGFRWRGRWLRRGVRFVAEPTGCGLRLRVSARAGDRYNYTGFFRGTTRELGLGLARIGNHSVVFNEPLTSARFRRSHPTASDARLMRARFSLRARWRHYVDMTVC